MQSAKLTRKKKAQSISAFDFLTLRTNINHGRLKFVLQELIKL